MRKAPAAHQTGAGLVQTQGADRAGTTKIHQPKGEAELQPNYLVGHQRDPYRKPWIRRQAGDDPHQPKLANVTLSSSRNEQCENHTRTASQDTIALFTSFIRFRRLPPKSAVCRDRVFPISGRPSLRELLFKPVLFRARGDRRRIPAAEAGAAIPVVSGQREKLGLRQIP